MNISRPDRANCESAFIASKHQICPAAAPQPPTLFLTPCPFLLPWTTTHTTPCFTTSSSVYVFSLYSSSRGPALTFRLHPQTQGDAWFKPTQENVHAGVCVRISTGQFRVFPYENSYLEPFEAAVRVLNPVVAVKVRSAAVHVALGSV